MEAILAYAISAGITGFGVWVFDDALNSSAPILLACAALISITIGLVSVFGDH